MSENWVLYKIKYKVDNPTHNEFYVVCTDTHAIFDKLKYADMLQSIEVMGDNKTIKCLVDLTQHRISDATIYTITEPHDIQTLVIAYDMQNVMEKFNCTYIENIGDVAFLTSKREDFLEMERTRIG